MSEEDIIVWQDVLDQVAAGRPNDLTCPFCEKATIKVEQRGTATRLECPSCGKYIEGAMR